MKKNNFKATFCIAIIHLCTQFCIHSLELPSKLKITAVGNRNRPIPPLFINTHTHTLQSTSPELRH